VFVIFNVQNNNEFGVQKNEIDREFKGIDEETSSIGEGYFIDYQLRLDGTIG
jgi:hypothetical protein